MDIAGRCHDDAPWLERPPAAAHQPHEVVVGPAQELLHAHGPAPGVDSEHAGLRTHLAAELRDQLGSAYCRGVDTDLVGSGLEQHRAQYAATVTALADAARTTVVLVTHDPKVALRAHRTRKFVPFIDWIVRKENPFRPRGG